METIEPCWFQPTTPDWASCFPLQGSWTIEGDTLKGIFLRKDNGKQLTTTRIIQGDELIQVGGGKQLLGAGRRLSWDKVCSVLVMWYYSRYSDFKYALICFKINNSNEVNVSIMKTHSNCTCSSNRPTATRAWTQRGFSRRLRREMFPFRITISIVLNYEWLSPTWPKVHWT